MATKKLKKAQKPTEKNKDVKAKPNSFKTKENPKLEKEVALKKGKELERPTKKEVDNKKNPDDVKKIYQEKRADRKHSDDNLKKKFEEGGAATSVTTPVVVEISIEEMKTALGREPNYPYDFIEGKKYIKCFLRPYYALKG